MNYVGSRCAKKVIVVLQAKEPDSNPNMSGKKKKLESWTSFMMGRAKQTAKNVITNYCKTLV